MFVFFFGEGELLAFEGDDDGTDGFGAEVEAERGGFHEV